MLEAEEKRKEDAYGPKTACFGLARVGYGNQKILAGSMDVFLKEDMGPPLHSFVICAEKLHHIEEEMWKHYLK